MSHCLTITHRVFDSRFLIASADTGALRDSGAFPSVVGYDGAPVIDKLTRGLVRPANLIQNLSLGCADVVMCMEVAEHIPRAMETTFLRNVIIHSRRSVILSWSSLKHPRGNGHINARPQEYVVSRMEALGFKANIEATRALRAAASIIWLKPTIARFDRVREESACTFEAR